jgi:hypothetical protein
MQDEADPQHTVLWTTNEWEAWPAGLSKTAARVVFDPLFFFTVFAPFYEVCLNQAWPHMIRNTAVNERCWYVLRRTALAASYIAAFYYFTGTPLAVAMVRQHGSVCTFSMAFLRRHSGYTVTTTVQLQSLSSI